MKKNKKQKQKKPQKTKIDWKIESYKNFENYMAAEIPSVVLLLKLT